MNDHPGTDDTLLEADQRHLIHPLHFPREHVQARIFVEGNGAMLRTADGTEYIDGLSALWNVNAGHGRRSWQTSRRRRWRSSRMRQLI